MAMLNNQRVPVVTPVVTAGASGVIMVLADGWFRGTFSISMCRRPPISKKSCQSKAMKAETFLHLRLTKNEGNIWPHWAVWIRTPCKVKDKKKGLGDSQHKLWNWMEKKNIPFTHHPTLGIWSPNVSNAEWWCPEVPSKSANLYPAKETLPN